MQKILIGAHRGAMCHAPENTLAALEKATEFGTCRPTFRLAALEYRGRIWDNPTVTDPRSSDEKWRILCEGLDYQLTQQEFAGTPVDLIVTSELPTCVSSGDGEVNEAQYVPGPRTDTIAALAIAHNCWIVVNPSEKDPDYATNDVLYHSTLVYDRSGELAVKYHKVRLPPEQSRFTPGAGPVVLDTEFGRMGILNCFEISASYGNDDYVQQIMALDPHFLIHPTWGHFGNEPVRVAADNGIYIATSVWDGSSRVIGPDGVLDEQYYGGDRSLPSDMKLAVADVPVPGTHLGFCRRQIRMERKDQEEVADQ